MSDLGLAVVLAEGWTGQRLYALWGDRACFLSELLRVQRRWLASLTAGEMRGDGEGPVQRTRERGGEELSTRMRSTREH